MLILLSLPAPSNGQVPNPKQLFGTHWCGPGGAGPTAVSMRRAKHTINVTTPIALRHGQTSVHSCRPVRLKLRIVLILTTPGVVTPSQLIEHLSCLSPVRTSRHAELCRIASTVRPIAVASESKLQSHRLQNEVRALEPDAAQAVGILTWPALVDLPAGLTTLA